MAQRRLLLFDIDGTLVDTGGVGIGALQDGFFEAFPGCGSTEFPRLELGGATDAGLAIFLFDHFGVEDSPENRERFFSAYTVQLQKRLEEDASGKGRLLPGVGELVQKLANHPDVTLALLTGNTREGARIKIDHFGVGSFFTTGAFGCDHHDRNQLGPIAATRISEETGRTFDEHQSIVIGDTLKDIHCARAAGFRVMTVATGACSTEALLSLEPDWHFTDFSDTSAVIDALLGE